MPKRTEFVPEIIIEKDIPMPPLKDKYNKPNLFANMERGDSFFIPKVQFNYTKNYAQSHRIKITWREEEKNDIDGYRIWFVMEKPPKVKKVSLISKTVGGFSK